MKAPSKGEKQGRRDPSTGQFLPGNKTGGRKRIPEDVKKLLADATPDAVKYLVALVNNDKARDSDRIRAAENILDRHLGKPIQAVDVDARNIPQVVIVGGDQLQD